MLLYLLSFIICASNASVMHIPIFKNARNSTHNCTSSIQHVLNVIKKEPGGPCLKKAKAALKNDASKLSKSLARYEEMEKHIFIDVLESPTDTSVWRRAQELFIKRMRPP